MMAVYVTVGWNIIADDPRKKQGVIPGQGRRALFEDFAAANGYEYSSGDGYQGNGALFAVGENHETRDVISGVLDGYAFKIYGHSFTRGNDGHKEEHYYEVIEIALSKHVPQIILDY